MTCKSTVKALTPPSSLLDAITRRRRLPLSCDPYEDAVIELAIHESDLAYAVAVGVVPHHRAADGSVFCRADVEVDRFLAGLAASTRLASVLAPTSDTGASVAPFLVRQVASGREWHSISLSDPFFWS